jgi:hypothetical protein
LLFPNAEFMNIFRDPMDNLLTYYKSRPKSDFISKKSVLISEYAMYLETMAHFRREIPGSVIDVSYEALVAEPERSLRVLLSRLDVGWDPSVLRFFDSSRHIRTASILQVREGVHDRGVGGWVKYADQLQSMIAALRRRLAPLHASGSLPVAVSLFIAKIRSPDSIENDSRNLYKQLDATEKIFAFKAAPMNWNFSSNFNYSDMLAALKY